MGGLKIDNSVVGTSSNTEYFDVTKNTTEHTSDFYNGSSKAQDSPTDTDTYWTVDWNRWHGYYSDVPVFAAVVDTLACWAVGKGYKTEDKVKSVLDRIKGWGKDDFNTVIENQVRVFVAGGDSFAEIIRDKAGRLTNLKPLNPGNIKTIINSSGIIKGYEQIISKEKFNRKEMFHLSWERLADETHGKPMAERAEPIIKQIKQLQEDLGLRFHRITKPVRLFEADIDDETKLAAVEVKLKNAQQKAEIIVIPKGTLEEKPNSPTPSAQDTLIYLDHLTRNFVTSCNVPEIILGWGLGATEATSKIIYLAFQQRIERLQLYLEEQIKAQLGIELEFEFPADLMETQASGVAQGIQSSQMTSPASMKKDGNKSAAQPKDVKA